MRKLGKRCKNHSDDCSLRTKKVSDRPNNDTHGGLATRVGAVSFGSQSSRQSQKKGARARQTKIEPRETELDCEHPYCNSSVVKI